MDNIHSTRGGTHSQRQLLTGRPCAVTSREPPAGEPVDGGARNPCCTMPARKPAPAGMTWPWRTGPGPGERRAPWQTQTTGGVRRTHTCSCSHTHLETSALPLTSSLQSSRLSDSSAVSSLDSYSKDSYSRLFLPDSTDSRV